MSPRKLTATDKDQILSLYRDTDATTSSLAGRFEVSSSTISRFLKANIEETEYNELIQAKRQSGRSSSDAGKTEAPSSPPAPVTELPTLKTVPEPSSADATETTADKSSPTPASKTRRRRSRAGSPAPAEETSTLPLPTPAAAAVEEDKPEVKPVPERPKPKRNKQTLPDVEADTEEDDELVLPSYLDEDLDGFDEQEEDEEENWDEDFEETEGDTLTFESQEEVSIFPLSMAQLPKTCYVVIDRSSDLVVRPLKDFSELGQIPPQEVLAQTLPVFDNQRVARRFSGRNRQLRVIRVPDGQLLMTTSPYLEAKGITHLLLDGKVYRLDGNT
ncbi:MAG: transposase [Cyanobacteria bacterium P01_H01_bin.15]